MLFEQQKNKEAARLFISIQDQLKQSDPAVIPSGVLTTVNTFVQALKKTLGKARFQRVIPMSVI